MTIETSGGDKWTIEDYIKNRVDDQLAYYDWKSSQFKSLYDWANIGSIILGVLIQLVLGGAVDFVFITPSAAAAVMSGAVTIFGGLLAHKQAKVRHMSLRDTCEWIRSERASFLSRAGDYYKLSDDDAANMFVIRFEATIRAEVKGYAQMLADSNSNSKQDGRVTAGKMTRITNISLDAKQG